MKVSGIRVFAGYAVFFAVACTAAPGRPGTPPAPVEVIPPLVPAPLPPSNAKLPPVPAVRGPVHLNVVYPKPDQLLTVRDSNFIFGSVGTGDAALRINGVAVPVWPNGAFMGWLPVPPETAPRYELIAANSIGSARLTIPIRIPPLSDTTARTNVVGDTLKAVVSPDTLVPIPGNVYVALGAPGSAVDDTDRVTIARPAPGNGQEYKWFLFPGTVVRVTGSQKVGSDEFVRIELDSGQVAWILRSELLAQYVSPDSLHRIIGDTLTPVRRVGDVRIRPTADWIDIVIPMTGPPPPYLVEETDRSLSLLLYGVSGAPVVSMMPQPADSYLNSLSTPTPEPTRVRYSINLNRPPYGYLALWQKDTLTFRVRRPARIADRANPLRGLTITVDPGHPPAGATGPTTLYEGDAVLQVGFKLRDLLTNAGAKVVMTRITPDPVDLGLRPIISRRANADAFVSIHLNAFPDGVNPFVNNGSLTLYFWPHSIPLGVATQTALLAEFGLRDNGTKFQNIAVGRGTWMPSILTEGAFIIMPDQEAAFRTPTYQEAYATAILRGLQSYFASLAQTP
ncbi:MAG: N-acetylmuramoyl-L-alanine amidase [Gemmatimonadota bacterium]|nr:N-acetylmuramoyl-L-alanine amidase [Gemmatimonadota bacterium]